MSKESKKQRKKQKETFHLSKGIRRYQKTQSVNATEEHER